MGRTFGDKPWTFRADGVEGCGGPDQPRRQVRGGQQGFDRAGIGKLPERPEGEEGGKEKAPDQVHAGRHVVDPPMVSPPALPDAQNTSRR
jgi:hypothetical protein